MELQGLQKGLQEGCVVGGWVLPVGVRAHACAHNTCPSFADDNAMNLWLLTVITM